MRDGVKYHRVAESFRFKGSTPEPQSVGIKHSVRNHPRPRSRNPRRRAILAPCQRSPLGSPPPSGTVTAYAHYDVDPRSERFLMLKGEGASGEIVVVVNWFEELRRRMGNE